jgi:hypothetical protein
MSELGEGLRQRQEGKGTKIMERTYYGGGLVFHNLVSKWRNTDREESDEVQIYTI